jgi:hypothetical protein
LWQRSSISERTLIILREKKKDRPLGVVYGHSPERAELAPHWS